MTRPVICHRETRSGLLVTEFSSAVDTSVWISIPEAFEATKYRSEPNMSGISTQAGVALMSLPKLGVKATMATYNPRNTAHVMMLLAAPRRPVATKGMRPSANAMTEDGVIVNIDGNANRVSAIAQGPKKVLFIVGMNKICDDVDGALKRARNVAAPTNAQRFGLDTPCAKTGSCMNCKSPDTICCQFLITRYSKHPGRIHVILVNDNLGF